MAVPNFQSLFYPTLEAVAAGNQRPREIRTHIKEKLGLTDEDVKELLPAGRTRKFVNRVAWSLSYLKRAELIEAPERGQYVITETGQQALRDEPQELTIKHLRKYGQFADWYRPSAKSASGEMEEARSGTAQGAVVQQQSPSERAEGLQQEANEAVEAELLDRLVSLTAEQFERRVLAVLSALGYSTSGEESSIHRGQSGDAGLDGEIKQDALGIDVIYIQAKKYAKNNTVGRPELQAFAGSLEAEGGNKGVFITTGKFTSDAIKYVEKVGKTIVLIDGKRLVQLMRQYDVGTITRMTVAIKDIDENFFQEDDV